MCILVRRRYSLFIVGKGINNTIIFSCSNTCSETLTAAASFFQTHSAFHLRTESEALSRRIKKIFTLLFLLFSFPRLLESVLSRSLLSTSASRPSRVFLERVSHQQSGDSHSDVSIINLISLTYMFAQIVEFVVYLGCS